MNRKVKILQITVRADIGGGPEHLFQLVKGSSEYFSHIIAAPRDKPYYSLFLNLVGESNFIEIPHRKFNILILIKLVREVKKRHISIIHSHGKGAGIYGRLVALLSSKKSVHTLHGFHVGNYNWIQKKGYIFVEKILSLITNKLVAVSEGELNEIVQAKICSTSKVTVIPNGVRVPDTQVSFINTTSNPKKIIMFSRFNYQKNTELLIKIVEQLKKIRKLDNFCFQIYGNGEEINLMKNLIEQKQIGNYVKLMGEDADARSKLVEGFCYISTSRWEGLPISLLEAMAVGLPVLATDVVGNNNIINDGIDGFLFDQNNINAAIEKLMLLNSNSSVWCDISQKARVKVEQNYSVERMINKTENLYII